MNEIEINEEKLNEVSIRVSKLISAITKENEIQKKRLSFAFDQKKRLDDIWKYNRNNNFPVLNALLTIQSFVYRTEFTADKLIERISTEVSLVEESVRKGLEGCQDIDLLNELKRRVDLGVIKLKGDNVLKTVDDNNQEISVNLKEVKALE